MKQRGVSRSADEILVTHGAQQALDLLLRLWTTPGQEVVVESPTYDQVLPLLRIHGLRPVGVPMTPEGLDLDALEATLNVTSPALLYTMPTFQNRRGRARPGPTVSGSWRCARATPCR